MNILVCVKQVPDTSEIKIDPVTHTLVREGVAQIVNTYDLYALEAAAAIKDELKDVSISVLTMGPASAEDALRECLAIAADEAWILSGSEFAGSDTMATAYALCMAIRHIEEIKGENFDAVFCGKQAIDGDTAQVGPALAELLGIPHVSNVSSAKYEEGEMRALREALEDSELIGVLMPCLITFTKPQHAPRVATLSRRMAAKKAEIRKIGAEDLKQADASRFGLKGSPTRVVSTAPSESSRNIVMLDKNIKDASRELANIISGSGLI